MTLSLQTQKGAAPTHSPTPCAVEDGEIARAGEGYGRTVFGKERFETKYCSKVLQVNCSRSLKINGAATRLGVLASGCSR